MKEESGFITTIKGIGYTLMIGAFYYAGAYGWSVIFIRDEEKRETVSRYNLLFLFLEILYFLTMFIISINQDIPNYNWVDSYIRILLVHMILNAVGTVFYLIWYIVSLFR